MNRTIDIIKANQSRENTWKKEATEHRNNWGWMKYSMRIAIKVRSKMKAANITQAALASKIGCTQQYISLLLKGKENLTLETIAKLESALDISLFDSSSNLVDGYRINESCPKHLSENDENIYGK